MLEPPFRSAAELSLRSRFLGSQSAFLFRRFTLLYRKYNPDQPRIPAGDPDGGQFTFGEGTRPDRTERIRLAQNTPRSLRGGRWPDATPAQQARLAASQAEANAATARVREVDGVWQPRPGLYQDVEGEILSNQSVARQAGDRLQALEAGKALPGPFARESVPTRPDTARPSAETQREINRIGREFGCHTCGTTEPETESGKFIGDHQGVTALRGEATQRYFPQCQACSRSQGGSVMHLLRRR